MALELGEQLIATAKQADDPILMAAVQYTQVWPLLNVGELVKARDHAARMVESYSPEKHGHWAYLYGYDYGVMALGFGSWVQWILGYPDRALAWNQQSISVARKLGHPFTLGFALLGGCEVHRFLGDFATVNRYTDELIPLSAEKGFVYWEGHGVFYRGERWTLEGQVKCQRRFSCGQICRFIFGHFCRFASFLWWHGVSPFFASWVQSDRPGGDGGADRTRHGC